MGFPSIQQAIDIVTRGRNFDVTARDFAVADAIYGKDIASLKGKTTKRATKVADISIGATVQQQQQILSVDIMYVEGVASLIGLATPLDLTMAVSLLSFDTLQSSRSAAVIKKGLEGFISTLASRNFVTRLIMTDGEGAIGAIKDDLNLLGIEVDVSGAGGHVARIERKIRTVKERARSYIAHQLPFTLNALGLAMLVLFCVSRINYQTPESRNGAECPRVAFTGRQVDAKLDYRVGFGEYVQCTVPNTDSNMSARTEDCIAMLPSGNRTASVKMMSLDSGRLIMRDQFTILPMPSSVIEKLNQMAISEGRKIVTRSNMVYGPQSGLRKADDPTYIQPTDVFPVDTADTANGAAIQETFHVPQYVSPNRQNLAVGGAFEQDAPPAEVAQENYFDMPDLDVGPLVEFEAYVEPNINPDASVPVSAPRSARTPTYTRYNTVAQPSPPLRRDLMNYYNANDAALTSVLTAYEPNELSIVSSEYAMKITVKEALRSRGADAERVILKELSQMIDKKVWTPVRLSVLTSTEKRGIIRSQMFLKEKYLPTGAFEKLKARLVAGGNQQDKDLYDDLSSPTVSTSVVMTVFAIAAYEKRNVSVVDITGAYLNADMNTGVTVYMRLDKTMSSMLCKIDTMYDDYTDDKGCIVVRLDKALYGCVESAALWYENLSDTLSRAGYKKNIYETCVYNKRNKNGMQCTVAVHVDDLIISSVDRDMIDTLCDHLRDTYGVITRVDGPVVNYLGMVFDLTVEGEVRMTMRGFVEDTIAYAAVTGTANSPATEGLFETRPNAEMAKENDRVWFHSVVAKLSYLAKRAKPECLTAIAYLATRVTRCTEDDLEKLRRVMRYIAKTRENGVVFRPGVLGICVTVYVDAAYGVHEWKIAHW